MSVAVASGEGPGELPEATYRRLSLVLRAGLTLALVLFAGALVVLVARLPGSAASSWIASNPLVRYLDLRQLASGLAAGSPEAYLTLGVFALIATPVLRVLSGTVAFFRHGERRLAAITSVVLALLLLGLLVVGPLVR
jgi:uncharacterized membrane protein